MPDWRIALSDLDYGAEEAEAVLGVLRSRWLSMGPEVAYFENEFADFIGVPHAIAVSNGTAALHLSYQVLDIGPGDEVIQPAINFVAAANMTLAVGAVPVFADIVTTQEPLIDPVEIESRITSRTRAIVVMHYGGYLCRMAEIAALCRKHRLALIEDACHAVGARYADSDGRPPHGRCAGAIGDLGCFSFFSNKNLATGEGGMIVTNRDDLADRLRLLRSHGMSSLTWDRHKGHAASYDVSRSGFNYRIDEIRAALGRVQLAKLSGNNDRRRSLVRAYRTHLSLPEGWEIPFDPDPGASACHLMAIVAPSAQERQRVAARLSAARIQTSLHYPCVTDFSGFQAFAEHPVPRSHDFAQRAITLPLYPTMTIEQITEICTVIANN